MEVKKFIRNFIVENDFERSFFNVFFDIVLCDLWNVGSEVEMVDVNLDCRDENLYDIDEGFF